MGALSELLPFLFLGLLFIVLVIPPFLRRKKRAEYEKEKRNAYSALRPEEALRQRFEELIVDFQTVSRELTAQTETRIRILNALLAEADAKIQKLRGSLGNEEEYEPSEQQGPQARKTPLADKARAEAKNQLGQLNVIYEDIYQLEDKGLTSIEIAEEVGMKRGEIELILQLRERTKNL